jgi:hypothetical protein
MSEPQKLVSEQYFLNNSVAGTPEAMASGRSGGGSFASFVQSAILFAVLAIGTAGVSFWMMQSNGKSISFSGGDLFMWIMGSDLSWEEYQRHQQDRGSQRLDESQFNWLQQVVNDAYSSSR